MSTTLGRRAAGAILAAALAFAGAAVAAPTTTAAPSAPESSLRWGFRQNFRTYVGRQLGAPAAQQLPVGERIVVRAPAAFDPAAAGTDEMRPYVLPVTSTSSAGGATTATTQGSVVYAFPAHYFKITLGDVKIVTSAAGASVVGDLTVVVLDGPDPDFVPGTYRSDDVVIGTTQTSSTVTTGGRVTIAATGLKLTKDGAAALRGFLPEGEALDDLTVSYRAPQVVKASAAVSAPSAVRYAGTAKVTVKRATGKPVPTGRVTVKHGTRTVGTATLTNGTARVRLSTKLPVGPKRTLTFTYGGDTAYAAVTVKKNVKVAKAAAKMTVKLSKKKITAKTKARVTVRVSASGTTPSGKVKVSATKGKKTVSRTVTLKKGKATATLPRLAKGTWKVKATYVGSSRVSGKTARTVSLKVR